MSPPATFLLRQGGALRWGGGAAPTWLVRDREFISLWCWIVFRASEGTLSCWSRLHLQSIAPTNPHWARVVGYGPFSLCAIHKEGLCPSSGGINRLMMMMKCLGMVLVASCFLGFPFFGNFVFGMTEENIL
jgi:hypothetical protein